MLLLCLSSGGRDLDQKRVRLCLSTDAALHLVTLLGLLLVLDWGRRWGKVSTLTALRSWETEMRADALHWRGAKSQRFAQESEGILGKRLTGR